MTPTRKPAKPAAQSHPGISPGLAALLDKRPALSDAIGKANALADTLDFAIRRRDKDAIRRKRELPGLRRIERAANRANDRNEERILAYRSRSLADTMCKLRLFADGIGYLPPFRHMRETYDVRMIVVVLREMERAIKASKGGAR